MRPAALIPAVLLLGLIAPALAGCTKTSPRHVTANPPAHHTAGGFRNPWEGAEDAHKGMLAFLKTRYFGDTPWPETNGAGDKIPRRDPDLEAITTPGPAPQVTWIGHATVLIQYDGLNILTDPVFSKRASPLPFAGPRRITPPALSAATLPPIDVVVLSHNHYDHMDLDAIRTIGDQAFWVVPLENGRLLEAAGITNYRELDWWQQVTFGRLSVTLTPARHWSGRGLFDRRRSLWGSFALRFADGYSVWYGGDTADVPGLFEEIGRRAGPFDLALIPIGAYAPRDFMGSSHATPEEAVRIHGAIRARQSIGVHWGSYILSAEPVDEPPRRLAAAVAARGLTPGSFTTLAIGETRRLEGRPVIERARRNSR